MEKMITLRFLKRNAINTDLILYHFGDNSEKYQYNKVFLKHFLGHSKFSAESQKEFFLLEGHIVVTPKR